MAVQVRGSVKGCGSLWWYCPVSRVAKHRRRPRWVGCFPEPLTKIIDGSEMCRRLLGRRCKTAREIESGNSLEAHRFGGSSCHTYVYEALSRKWVDHLDIGISPRNSDIATPDSRRNFRKWKALAWYLETINVGKCPTYLWKSMDSLALCGKLSNFGHFRYCAYQVHLELLDFRKQFGWKCFGVSSLRVFENSPDLKKRSYVHTKRC